VGFRPRLRSTYSFNVTGDGITYAGEDLPGHVDGRVPLRDEGLIHDGAEDVTAVRQVVAQSYFFEVDFGQGTRHICDRVDGSAGFPQVGLLLSLGTTYGASTQNHPSNIPH
jgi:hypothetical protein